MSTYSRIDVHFPLKIWNKISVRMNGGTLLSTQNVVFQENENECGIAALAMILKHFNIVRNVSYLRKKVRLTDLGMTMEECVKIAKQEGLNVTAAWVNWHAIRNYPTPLLTIIRNSHYVVVENVDSSNVRIRDPAAGIVIYEKGVWENIWKGPVLIFQ